MKFKQIGELLVSRSPQLISLKKSTHFPTMSIAVLAQKKTESQTTILNFCELKLLNQAK